MKTGRQRGMRGVRSDRGYVGLADVEDDGISFEEKMQKLSGELKKAFLKGHKLEEEIKGNLKELGFYIYEK